MSKDWRFNGEYDRRKEERKREDRRNQRRNKERDKDACIWGLGIREK